MHTSVLLKEAIDGLNVVNGGRYIDATYGVGGHSNEIVKRGGNVLALDWDEENVEKRVEDGGLKLDGKLKLVNGNFADIETIAKVNDFAPVDGVLFDLGLSMEQIGQSGRGFSFKKMDEPLDMRISNTITKTAASIINSSNADELYEILSRNSQEVDSRAISQAIFSTRRMKPIATVGDLVGAVSAMSRLRDKKESILRRLFQALRMEVNDELDNIKRGIEGALKILKPAGRIAVITFHETEDRYVKQVAQVQGLTLITKKPIIAHSGLSFEGSAKLRIMSTHI